jgi:hypothetical protein
MRTNLTSKKNKINPRYYLKRVRRGNWGDKSKNKGREEIKKKKKKKKKENGMLDSNRWAAIIIVASEGRSCREDSNSIKKGHSLPKYTSLSHMLVCATIFFFFVQFSLSFVKKKKEVMNICFNYNFGLQVFIVLKIKTF